jgi:hypothetical protein
MRGDERAAALNANGGRLRLAPRDPLIEQTIASSNLNLDEADLEDVRRWGNSFRRSRDAWADLNRNGRRYSDKDAPAAPIRSAHNYGGR